MIINLSNALNMPHRQTLVLGLSLLSDYQISVILMMITRNLATNHLGNLCM